MNTIYRINNEICPYRTILFEKLQCEHNISIQFFDQFSLRFKYSSTATPTICPPNTLYRPSKHDYIRPAEISYTNVFYLMTRKLKNFPSLLLIFFKNHIRFDQAFIRGFILQISKRCTTYGVKNEIWYRNVFILMIRPALEISPLPFHNLFTNFSRFLLPFIDSILQHLNVKHRDFPFKPHKSRYNRCNRSTLVFSEAEIHLLSDQLRRQKTTFFVLDIRSSKSNMFSRYFYEVNILYFFDQSNPSTQFYVPDNHLRLRQVPKQNEFSSLQNTWIFSWIQTLRYWHHYVVTILQYSPYITYAAYVLALSIRVFSLKKSRLYEPGEGVISSTRTYHTYTILV